MLNVFNRSILILNEKISKVYLVFIIFVLTLSIGILITLKYYNYDSLYITQAISNNGKISINIYDDYLNNILSNNKVTINENEYSFEVDNLSSPSLDLDNKVYYSLDIHIKDYFPINNQVINLSFKYRENNLLQNFLKIIKEA